jgi:transcription antitermination factor NusG
MTSPMNSYPWFALQTRSRCENVVATQLRGKGYDPFLPMYKSRRRWSDRVKELELPLFPGYLFCQFNPLDRLPILVTPGVLQVVGTGKNPIPVDDAEIATIWTVMRSALPRQPWPCPQVGQRVRVEHGPLSGVEGILQSFKGGHRIVLSVALLQRSVAVEVDESWVSPIHLSISAASTPAYVQAGS